MPHDQHRLNPEETERLSRKIERLLAGQPSPVLDNPDTEDLAELAAMLRRYLPEDLPDPGFRAQLKEDLINPRPRLVHLPRSRPRRYPIPAFAGALAVAVIATMAAGWMAFGGGNEPLNRAASLAATPTSSSQPVAFAMATTTAVATEVATTSNSDRPDEIARTGVTDDLVAGNADFVGESAGDEVPEETAPEPIPTATVQPTSTQTTGMTHVSAPVDLPPIDTAHVELGALATATGDPVPTVDDVTFTLADDLPELAATAPAYRFATPRVHPEMIVSRVAEIFDLNPDTAEPIEQQGRTVYSLSSPDTGAKFTFSPTTGAFSCTVPEAHAAANIEDLTTWAIDWVHKLGLPLDPDEVSPIIQTLESGDRVVHVQVANAPNPAVGHPMSVSLVVDPQGRFIRASGYWLQSIDQQNLTLLTAEQAWEAISAGQGYWPSSNAPTEPGEFRVDALDLTYMLTIEDDGQLVLQPVISASGTFHPNDGSESLPSTVYLQAAAQV